MSRHVPGNVESILRWMLHHWMDARAIDLTMHPLIKDLPAEATRLLDSIGNCGQGEGADFHAPTALRVFRGSFISDLMAHKAMMAKERNGSNGARPLYISEGPLERLCARLLPLMGRLTALNLSMPKAPQLPSFNELEHLELHSINFEGMQQSLMGLHSLQTLFLSCEHLEALLPELRLTGLPRLRHVRLDDVFPAELSLPPGCRLDIKGEAAVMDEVIGAAWKDALQHLHACTCRWTLTRKTGLRHVNVHTLPSFLSMAAGCIQELSLDGTGGLDFSAGPAGQQPIRLDPAIFCNLKKLGTFRSSNSTWKFSRALWTGAIAKYVGHA
ncbi:g2046 [Coccomyxa elongata]